MSQFQYLAYIITGICYQLCFKVTLTRYLTEKVVIHSMYLLVRYQVVD